MTARHHSRALYRLIGIVGTSRIVTLLHPVAYRLFRGAGVLGHQFGMRNIILTTTGHRSGRPREAPLFSFEDGDRVVVIGSNAGGPRDPSWVRNLRANPAATLRVGGEVRPVQGHIAAGEERARLWATAVERYPGYELYQRRAGRTIPVVVLIPREAPQNF
jgi:deazaflavin-dependent oxidoreductase (nitroreductase family)